MRLRVILGSLLILALICFSSAYALTNQQHTVTVNVQRFAKVTVVGPSNLATTITPTDVSDDGTATKTFDQNPVKVRIKSNTNGNCDLSVSGTSDQGFSVSLLQVSADNNFSSPVILGNGTTSIKSYSSNEVKSDISLYWRVKGDVTSVTPDTDHVTTVTYTVAAN